MTKHSLIRLGVVGLALAIACALGWWVHKETQKRELKQHVVALVQDSTVRLREALQLLTAEPGAHAKLEADFTTLEGNVDKTRTLNASIDPTLVEASIAYVTDVHALLRRQLALHAGRDAVRIDIGEINNHLRTAGTRSPDWIGQALALKQRLERSFFDYRFAAGGLEKSLGALNETSTKLRTYVPVTVVVEDDAIFVAKKRLLELSAQIEQQVANARRLPAGG